MRNWLNNPLTVVALIVLGLSMTMNIVQYQDAKELNAEWREAATPVFQSRGPVSVEAATPDTLSQALNPCAAFSWLERGRMKQMGCDSQARPQGPVHIEVSFVSPRDQELDPNLWWY